MIPALASAIGPLGSSEWTVPSLTGAGGAAPATGAAGPQSFGSTLTNAIGSLEQTQNNASQAAQQLATGQLADPTQAVTAVENASLAMDLASQIRNKLTDATTTIFQTQI